MRKYNYILSVVMTIVGIAGIFIAANFKTLREPNLGDPGASAWPIFLCSGLVLCSVLLLIRTLIETRKAKAAGETEDPLVDFRSKGVICVLEIFAIMIIYAVMLYYLGFLISTPVFIVLTMLAMGERRITWILFTTAGITGFIYVAFALIMKVVLPRGQFF